MSRSTRTIILSVVVALVTGACSSGSSNQTTASSVTSPPGRVAITDLHDPKRASRGLLTQPVIVPICGTGASKFCVDLPTDGDPVQLQDIRRDGDNQGIYLSDIRVDPSTAAICPDAYSDNPLCQKFNDELYQVVVTPYQAATADVMAIWRNEMPPQRYRDVREGTFAGEPAIFSTFLSPLGGSGPFIDVWHGGAIYSIWSTGLTTAAHFADAFQASFRFTD